MNKGVFVIMLLTTCLIATAGQAQNMSDNLLLTKDNSVDENAEKVYKATQSIRFESGFTAKEGCEFYASVIPMTEEINLPGKEIDNTLEVYPNPVEDDVVVKGIFSKERLIIYDESGNPVQSIVLDGENPAISLRLDRGQYLLKVAGRSLRVVKNK